MARLVEVLVFGGKEFDIRLFELERRVR